TFDGGYYREQPDQILRAEDLVGGEHRTQTRDKRLPDRQTAPSLTPVYQKTKREQHQQRERLENHVERPNVVERDERVVRMCGNTEQRPQPEQGRGRRFDLERSSAGIVESGERAARIDGERNPETERDDACAQPH